MSAIPTEVPFANTYYFTGDGMRWRRVYTEQARDERGEPLPFPAAVIESQLMTYQAGRTYDEEWNRGVFGPALGKPRPTVPQEFVTRTGNTITVAPAMYGDGAGRWGSDVTAGIHIALFREGIQVGEAFAAGATFEVPTEAARYRLEISASRGGADSLSTKIDAAWTFRSGFVAGDQPHRLPLSSVTVRPRLDEYNRALPGPVPIDVVAQPGSSAGTPREVSVAFSVDDGRTWRDAPVVTRSGRLVALVAYPAHGGYVSIRTRMKDSAGNTTEQTIIRGYRTGAPTAAGGA